MISVNVLMSSYNGEKYIEEQINSILSQKGKFNLHLIIRDDGSSDNTCGIIKAIQKENPEKISLIMGENIGYNAAFFELLKISNDADYFCFSDQDDIWLDNKVQNAINLLENEDQSVPLLYGSRSYVVDDNLKPLGLTRKKSRDITFYNSIIQNILPGHTQVMNLSLVNLLRGNIDSSKIYVYDSWVLNVAMIFGKVIFDNNPHTYYRQHKDQQMGYGKGIFGKLISSAKRSKKGDWILCERQISYFGCMYEKELCELGFKKEIDKIVNSKKISGRIKFVFSSKTYRQSLFETFCFRMMYLFKSRSGVNYD